MITPCSVRGCELPAFFFPFLLADERRDLCRAHAVDACIDLLDNCTHAAPANALAHRQAVTILRGEITHLRVMTEELMRAQSAIRDALALLGLKTEEERNRV